MYMTTLAAGLTGRKPAVYLYEILAFPFRFILQHLYKHSPPIIRNGLPEFQSLFQCRHIKVFDSDQVVVFHKIGRQLMEEVTPLMLGFRMELCDFDPLPFVSFGAFF